MVPLTQYAICITMQNDILKTIRAAVPGLVAVYQFGSTTDGTTHADSDLDLAVLARRPLPNLDRWELQEELAVRVGRDVDLVDLRSASTVMQAQVIDTADLLAEADRTARQEFEMQVCSAYALRTDT